MAVGPNTLFRQGRKVVVVMFSQGITGLGGVVLAAVIGRLGGLDVLGMFTVMLSLLGALALIAQRGQANLISRAVAWASHADGVGVALRLLSLALRRVVLPSVLLGIVGSVLLWSGALGEPFPYAAYILPIALIGVSVLAVLAGYSRGRRRPYLGPLFEMGGISLATTTLLLAIFAIWGSVSHEAILAAFCLGILLLLGLAGLSLGRDSASALDQVIPSLEQQNELRKGQIAFTLIGASLYLCQTGSFMVASPFLVASDLGLLRMAERIALLVSFPMLAIRPVVAPSMVKLARIGDPVNLKRTARYAVLASTMLSLPILLFLYLFPDLVLGLAGEEFIKAVPFLFVMLLAQFVVAVVGPLVGLLHMTNREKASTWINVTTLGAALLLFPTLTSTYGAMGFAIAYALTNIGRLSAVAVYIHVTGILGPNVAKTSE